MTVSFYFKQPVTLKNRNALKAFIESLFKSEKVKAEQVTYIFCSDDELLNINKEFLKHDFYTDIITFDLSDSRISPKKGDIYISVDRVKDNARVYDLSISKELHRVIIHGILHLCGYKDKSAKEIKLMRFKEDLYLSKYGF